MPFPFPWDDDLTCERLKKTAVENRIHFIECFLENSISLRRVYQNGYMIVAANLPIRGVGVRYQDADKVYFFPFHDFSKFTQAEFSPVIQKLFREIRFPVEDAFQLNIPDPEAEAQIRQRLYAAHDQAWNDHWAVESVTVEWEEKYSIRQVINSDYTRAQEFYMEGIMLASATLVRGSGEFNGIGEYRFYSHETRPDLSDARKIGTEAVRQAIQRMECRPFPKGIYPVILKAGQCGNLIHEILAHALEADMVISGLSYLSGYIGQSLASPQLTVADDARSVYYPGQAQYDDEGTPLQRTELIRDGILSGYLHDRRTAEKTGASLTGSARRENYAFLPLPRFRHLAVDPGPEDPDEIIRSVDQGLMLESVRHGESDPCTGQWIAKADKAWWIERGRIQYPVGPVMVMGEVGSALRHIECIGCDAALDSTAAFCVKKNQRLSVSASHPTMKISHLRVTGLT